MAAIVALAPQLAFRVRPEIPDRWFLHEIETKAMAFHGQTFYDFVMQKAAAGEPLMFASRDTDHRFVKVQVIEPDVLRKIFGVT